MPKAPEDSGIGDTRPLTSVRQAMARTATTDITRAIVEGRRGCGGMEGPVSFPPEGRGDLVHGAHCESGQHRALRRGLNGWFPQRNFSPIHHRVELLRSQRKAFLEPQTVAPGKSEANGQLPSDGLGQNTQKMWGKHQKRNVHGCSKCVKC